MFEPTATARVFCLPVGVDFPKALVEGLQSRAERDALARVELFVNTRRMQSRIRTLFDGKATFLPRLRLITDLANDPSLSDIPAAVPGLRRRLELRQLISALLEKEPDLAPKSAAFDLADSLAELMDEMHSEGVSPDALKSLDVGDMSAHWARSLRFIALIERFFDRDALAEPDVETRQRLVVEATIAKWKADPPDHPIIIAGSTGSRGATSLLMQAVSRLPQGAIVLPGFDRDMPASTWSRLNDAMSAEDHPQFRFAKLMAGLQLRPENIQNWTNFAPSQPERNKLVSLALRPAPVTDQWQSEGSSFQGVDLATKDLTLIEARTPRDEAMAIACALRHSIEENVPVALITPDRNLTRKVAAALSRWGIEPDDSAGKPLALSAPGRFLRHVADLLCENIEADALLTLLKHPLTHSAGDGRGDHLRWTRDLELQVLRGLPGAPDPDLLLNWSDRFADEPARQRWISWIASLCFDQTLSVELPLEQLLSKHLELAERLASGPEGQDTGELWRQATGQVSQEVVSILAENAPFGGDIGAAAYRDLIRSVLNKGEVREPVTAHPGVMFWGTLEARVQGADRVILAGLNDGSWPELPGPDPWLNRKMRLDAGLLLPERRIGLSAHDFQQAIATKEVILSRATRDEESETIPSRWLNRLTNLLAGMSAEGVRALSDMRERGKVWIDHAAVLDKPTQSLSPEPRPSPAPPSSTRPDRLSATAITRLIRDPYAIYAEKILGIRALAPLRQGTDALLRGTVTHRIFERFVDEPATDTHDGETARLTHIASEVLSDMVPGRTMRTLWLARIERIADWFVEQEALRRSHSRNLANEVWGEVTFEEAGFTLGAKADRVDQDENGRLTIYDYKTGNPPTEKMQSHFDKQLLLEAVIAKNGGFRDFEARQVASVSYIGLTPKKEMSHEVTSQEIDSIQGEFLSLIAAYQSETQGYTSRRAMHMQRFDGDYDHLARFGEWDDSDAPEVLAVGRHVDDA